MENQNNFGSDFDVTEDFTELLGNKQEVTEQLDVVKEEKTEELVNVLSSNKFNEEIHFNDLDDDFSNIMRKRDYKGKVDINNVKEKKHGKKRKLKKWVYILLLLVLIGGGFATYKIIDNRNIAKKQEEEKRMIENIKNHYYKYAKVSKDTVLYEKKDNEYQAVGTIYQDVNVELVSEEIKIDTKYFHIKDLDYYLSYEDVLEGEEEKIDTRYKSYLPFNINIITKDKFTMNIDNDKYLTLDKSMEFPVIINNYEGKYYVEYNNRLVNISKDDVSETKENKNTDKKNQAKMTTLAYHRVYDTTDKCTDPYVCLKKEVFDKQMKYLSDNNYFTLTMDEMYMYMMGYLQIEKGVVITIDDGLLFKSADEVLDKYGLRGTLFIATGAFTNYAQFEGLKAIENQSHTHDMHKNYVCSGGNQGGAILCAGKEKIIADLKKSLETLNMEPKALAYPFYDYNDVAISAVKEVGFKMAFVGRAGVMGKATPKVTDLYKIPRMTVWEESLMSYNSWKSYL